MKKSLLLLSAIIFVITAIAAFAEDEKNVCMYDDDVIDGNLLTHSCWFYDDAGQKTIDPEAGYAGKTNVYEHLIDIEGRFEEILEMYLDPDGNLISGPNGYAKMTTDYVLHEDGPVCRYMYDPGAPVNDICAFTRRYFDANEEPVFVRNGDISFRYFSGSGWIGNSGMYIENGGFASASILYTRDDSQFMQKTSYFDTDGQPLLYGDVYASFESIIILADHTWIQRYLGTDGELIETPWGYSCSVQSYTEDDKESFIRYYDAQNQPTTDAQLGVHAIHYFYGPGYRQVPRTDYLDVNDNLTNISEGYSTIINEYREKSPDALPDITDRQAINTYYLDKDGNIVELDKSK